MTLAEHFKSIVALLRNNAGTAAMETALGATVLTTIMLNGVELGRYYYAKMEVENAAQMAAYSVYKYCDTNAELPAHTNCTGNLTRLTSAMQQTSLGTAVTVNSTAEGHYCIATSGSLTSVGNYTATAPANCSSVGLATDIPGQYFLVSAQYTYAPIFTGISIGSALPATIQKTTMVRLK